jgi:hypothetical protein
MKPRRPGLAYLPNTLIRCRSDWTHNILVLCQDCHKGLSAPHGDLLGDRLIAYTCLKRDLRERVAAYVESKDPKLTTFIAVLRAGPGAAEDYFFRRLEMRRPRPPDDRKGDL